MLLPWAMIAASPTKRMASTDEVAIADSYFSSVDGGFISDSDLLIDGGVIAAIFASKLRTPDQAWQIHVSANQALLPGRRGDPSAQTVELSTRRSDAE